MEPLGAFPDGEWESISRLLFTEDSFQYDHSEGLNFGVNPSSFWFSDEANENMGRIDESLFFSSDNVDSNLGNFSQESSSCSYSSSGFLPIQSQQDNCYLSDYNHIPNINNLSNIFELSILNQKNIFSNVSVCPDVLTRDVGLDGGHSEAGMVPQTESHLKWKSDILEQEVRPDNKSNESPKKRSRISRYRVNKNVQSKKSQKLKPIIDDEEEDNAGQNGQTTSCYSSEDDSKDSLELTGGANSDSKVAAAINLNSKKTKASKVSATDSQSIYARKRREKINERLKILQNLVPNGTKVDISTMLEEAVHYVKFLQVQIKLLSSDDHWMYAPIAHNGMDISLLRHYNHC